MQALKKIAFLSIFSLIFSLASPPAPQAKVISTFGGFSPAGSLIPIGGKVFLTTLKGKKKKVKEVSDIFPGQTVNTEPESFAELRLRDGSVINLGPKSNLKIEEFYYDPNMDSGKMNVRISSGVYRLTSGRINNGKSESYIRISLPAGKVDLRSATVLGEIFEKRAVTILWKAPQKVESFEPLTVKTKENDPYYQTVLEKQGFGCVIEDENFSPTPALKVPDTDIAWIESQLFPAPKIKKEEPPAEKPKEFNIQAIVYDQEDSSQSRLVVVSGRLYKENDIVEDHKILMIEPKSVAVKNLATGETKTLKVTEPDKNATVKKAEEVKPILESVFHDKHKPKDSFAYVNGTLYRAGASVLGFKILEIGKDGIKLKNEEDGKESILKLRPVSGGKQGEIPLVLQSISFDADDATKSMAALNGVLYHQGESWENFEVTEILADRVMLTEKTTGKKRKIALEKLPEAHDEKPNLEIQVILFEAKQKEKSQVAIKGKLYKSGELVEGYEILEIGKQFIRVRKKGDNQWKTYIINDLPARPGN